MFKKIFRILSFARPYYLHSFLFFATAFLATVFGVLNLGLLVPLLKVLFNNLTEAQLKTMVAQYPTFNGSINYFLEVFNYFFAVTTLQYGKFAALQFVAFIIIGSVFLTNLFYYLSMMAYESIKNNLVRNLRKAFFDKMLDLHIGYFDNQRKGDLMVRSTGDIGELEGMVIRFLDIFFRYPLALIVYFTCLLFISLQLTLFTLLIIPVSGGIIALIGKALRKTTHRLQQLAGEQAVMTDETLSSLRVIRSYNATDYVRKKFHDLIENTIKHYVYLARTRELASPFSEVAGVSIVMGVVLYGGNLIFANNSNLSAEAFITYIVVFSQILSPAKGMSIALTNIQKGLASADRVFEVLDTKCEITNVQNPVVLENFEQKIEFKNVGFQYVNDKNVLENINFEVKKGQTVALVGTSGSGKSTLADLTLRFYDVTQGEILIDGTNIKNIDLRSLETQIAIVTQNSILFNDTIFNNIAFGKIDASQEQVEKAAIVANAHNYIIKKDKQYQEYIGDRGDLLAGGEKQRLAIARAVFKNAPILILDEATSALDSQSEKLVQDALDKLMQNRTSIVIAHRLSTIKRADLILVLEKGKIIERGTHQELMNKQDGMYKKMVEIQTLFS